jgi:hypothetical protein
MYIGLPPGSTARMAMNDVPFFEQTAGPESFWMQQSPASHLLQPGENELLLEVEHPQKTGRGRFELNIDQEWESPVFGVYWPQLLAELPPEQQSYPFVYRKKFTPPGQLFRPAYYDAPAQPVTDADRLEIQKRVFDIQKVVHDGDADGFVREMSFKIQEFKRSRPPEALADVDNVVNEAKSIFAHKIETREVEPDRLILEERAEGRVVHARPRDGGKLIEVRSLDDPTVSLRTDLMFTRTGDQHREVDG